MLSAYRQLYLTDHDTWKENLDCFHHQVGSQWVHLIEYSNPEEAERLYHEDPEAWEQLPEVQEWIAAGKPILLSGAIRSEIHADIWHEHPKVSRLPHSIHEASLTLEETCTDPKHCHKNFKQQHLDVLNKHFGVQPDHTVWDVHELVKAKHPGVRLTRPY